MQGLIFIPDITGFTNFVNRVNIDLGVSIVEELLNEIIQTNPLNLELSEIEGDAILYYKLGQPIAKSELFDGARLISKAFNMKYAILRKQYNLEAALSLKFIVHYGYLNVYNIGRFQQLYGETVIEAHKLLKSGCGGSDYILITKDYIAALQQTTPENLFDDDNFSSHRSDLFTGLRNITYYFYNNFSVKVNEPSFALA